MPPRGGNSACAAGMARPTRFKSCPREGATPPTRRKCRSPRCFKSCPREGGNIEWIVRTMMTSGVSSHAPARGATLTECNYSDGACVSSHAPARGATYADYDGRLPFLRFKSCPREGATQNHSAQGRFLGCFKSCPREGATSLSVCKRMSGMFQVMPPRGGNQVTGSLNVVNIVVSSHAPARGQHIWMI